jgi:FG-GAP-like repeat/EF hand
MATFVPSSPGFFTMRFPGWTDSQGWSSSSAYSSILCADVDGDRQAEILGIVGGSLQTYHFDRAWGQWQRLADYDFPDSVPTFVATQAFDLDRDGQCELVLSFFSGATAGAFTLHFNSHEMTWSLDPSWGNDGMWVFSDKPVEVACGQIGDVGQLFFRAPAGVIVQAYPAEHWDPFASPTGPLLTDEAGWGASAYAATMRCADVDGDGDTELLIRGANGIQVFSFDSAQKTWTPAAGNAASSAANGPPLSDSAGWSDPAYYSTIQLADVDGDGRPELVGSGPGGIYVFRYESGAWGPNEATEPNGPLLESVAWKSALYFPTITCADVDGDGRAEVVARAPQGVMIFDYDPSTATWTPSSDAGPVTGPTWSDANGWGEAAYSLTFRAADVNGDGRAELIGRLADGVRTVVSSDGGSPWADASAPFPVLQQGAYNAISTALGVANAQLRTTYADEIATLTEYEIQLGDQKFLADHDLDPSWQPSVDQLYTEVKSAIAVQALFNAYDQYLLDVTLSDKIDLDSAASSIQLTQQVRSGSKDITANIYELLSGLVWALSVSNPALAVVSGLADSALSFATSLSNTTVPINPVTEVYEALNTQIGTSFNALRRANSSNEATVLGDYGLLVTMGRLIESGQWAWPVSPNPDPQTVTEMRYTTWAWQTLSPLVWTVFDDILIDGQTVPGDRPPPDQYNSSWFWFGPKTRTPNTWPPTTTKHVRWLLLGADQGYGPVPASVLQQLFGDPPAGVGAAVTDVLTGANGWALPLTPRG